VLAGVFCAAGVWAGIELMIAVMAGACATGLLWVMHGGRALRDNRTFAAAFALALAALLIVERGPAAFLRVEYDRLSIAHLAAAAALAGLWLTLGALQQRCALASPAQRLAAALAAGSGAAACLYLGFPALFAGPAASFDPAIGKIWLERVQEMQPLWPHSPAQAAKMITFLGIALLALPWLVFRLAVPPWRAPWLVLGLAMLALLPAALAHLRMAPYAEIVAGFAIAGLLHRLLGWSARIAALLPRVALRSGAIAALLAPFAAASAVPQSQAPPAQSQPLGSAGCDLRPLARLLGAPEFAARPRTILTFVDFGPELLYRTPHRVIATPYHRNVAGIGDVHRALSGPPAEARAILERRAVELIFLCTEAAEARLYARAPVNSLYAQLLRGELPPGIIAAALPAGSPPGYRLYRIAR
jgi:hypothetical protein